MPSLIVKTSSGTRTVELGDDAVTFGRTSDNTVPLDDAGASRKHAQILFVGRGWEMVDLGSRNGTLVNGQKVPRAMLKPGDVIAIGGVTITFQDDAGVATAAPADDGLDIEELDLDGDDDATFAAPLPPAPGGGGGGRPSTAGYAAPASGPTGACRLRIVGGERQGEEIDLTAQRTTFGRRASNTITFKESAVSGVHAEIGREANGFVLRDLGSTNGTVVDGEPVVEIVLRHNARIQMGAQKMIFVDTSVADIESALTADDFEGDWGMMRGEIDVTAGGRGGGLAAAAAIIVVAGAAAGGFYFLNNAAAGDVTVESDRDNRIVDWSFEDGISRWFPGDDESAAAQVTGGRDAATGSSGLYALDVSPAGDAPGRVSYSAGDDGGTITVTPDTAYAVSAMVGSGKGAVVVRWLPTSRGVPVREESTPLVDGSSGWAESSAVVVAPAQARAARVELVAFDGVTASFDDVVFKRAETAAPTALKSGELRVRVNANGAAEAVRGGNLLFTAAGVAPSVETSPADLLGSTLSGPVSSSEGSVEVAGTHRGGGSFRMKIEAVPGGALIDASGAGGAFTLTCPGGLARGAVTLVMSQTARVLSDEESVDQEGVRKVIVGRGDDGPAPFVLSAAPGSEGFHFTSLRTARGLRVQLAAPEGAEDGAVRLAIDLSREDEAAGAVYKQAEEHRSKGELGSAIMAFDRVAVEWHYLERQRDRAIKERDAMAEVARAELDRLEKLAGGSMQFGDIGGLERVVGDCTRFASRYAGHPMADEASALATKAAEMLVTARTDRVDSLAESLYFRAKDYEAMGRIALALHLHREVVRVAPEDHDFRVESETEIPKLEAALTKAMSAQFE